MQPSSRDKKLNLPKKISAKRPWKLQERFPKAHFAACQKWMTIGSYATEGIAKQAQEDRSKTYMGETAREFQIFKK